MHRSENIQRIYGCLTFAIFQRPIHKYFSRYATRAIAIRVCIEKNVRQRMRICAFEIHQLARYTIYNSF